MAAQDELLHAISVISDSFGDKFDAENFKEMVSLTKAYYQDRRYFRSLVAARDEERKGRTHLIKSVRSGNITWAKKLLELLDDIDNYTVESTQFLGKECYICYEQFEENQIVYKVPCRGQHIFHKECIDKWVTINSSCPYCRDPISLEDITGYINKSSQTDKNVLYYAIKVGNLPFVEQLIEKGAMIQYRNASPLHLAAGFSHNDLITYFLAKGENIEKTDGYGNTPLYYAASYAKPSTIKCLLDNSANYFFSYYNERTDCKEENTILHVAVKWFNRESIPFILDFFKQKNLSIDMKDSENHTPLHIAILQRYNDVVNMLVEAGADLTCLDENHPLYPSLKAHFYEDDDYEFDPSKHTIFGYLLQKTEEAFKENFQAYQQFLSGLLKQACKLHEMEHVQYLLRKYQNVNIDKECFSTLCCSRATDYFSKHKLLDRLFEYPEFFLACVKADNKEVVKAYIERKNNMNIKDEKANSPLHLAKSMEMFELLFDHCDIHCINEDGETLLHSYLGRVSLSHRKPLSYEDAFKDLFKSEEVQEQREEEEDEDFVPPTVRRAPLDDDDDEEIVPVPAPIRRPTVVKKVVAKLKGRDMPRSTVIDLLIQKGVDLHAKTKKGLTALQIACHYTNTDNFSSVLRILDAGVDINECSTYQAPLHIALLNENNQLIKELVRRGADINRLFDEETILHYAVHKQDKELVKLLFEKGIDVNLKNKRGETALWHAFLKAGLKEDELCQLFIEKGAVLKDSIHHNISKFLFQAVESGSLKTVKLLVEMGADVNVENEYKRTPFQKCHLYEQSGREIAEFLLSSGVNIDKQNNDGESALWSAALDDWDGVKFLLEHGANPQTKDSIGRTALFNAVGNVPPEADSEYTIEATERQLSMVKLLVEKGANVNERDNEGKTPIFVCPSRQVLKYLIEQGADINTTDLSGQTLLFEKIGSINAEQFSKYKDLGVDINKQDNRGYSVLHEAITKKKETDLIGGYIFVEYLLLHGADPLLKTNEGLTAIDLAVRLEKHTLVDRLKKKDGFVPVPDRSRSTWFMNRVNELTFQVVEYYPEGTNEDEMEEIEIEVDEYIRMHMSEDIIDYYIEHVLQTPDRAKRILVLKIEEEPTS